MYSTRIADASHGTWSSRSTNGHDRSLVGSQRYIHSYTNVSVLSGIERYKHVHAIDLEDNSVQYNEGSCTRGGLIVI